MQKFTFTLIVLLFPVWASSATFCVNDAAELVSALSSASNNNEDDNVRIRSGDYQTINSMRFNYTGNDGMDLTLSGGWQPFNQFDCFVQTGHPLDTTLDGNGTSGVLLIQTGAAAANIEISNLTINNGFSDVSTQGSGLHINALSQSFTGQVLVEQTAFLGNDGMNGSGLYVVGQGTHTVRNNVFSLNNTANGNGTINLNLSSASPGLYFLNNTVLNNTTDVTDVSVFNASGLSITISQDQNNTPEALVANNIFWGQESSDLAVTFSGGLTYVYNNNYQLGDGLIEDQQNNQSVNPMLEPALLDFSPQPGSPMIDAGLSPHFVLPSAFLQAWDPGSHDFENNIVPRISNDRIDMGAIETAGEPAIFKNGFE